MTVPYRQIASEVVDIKDRLAEWSVALSDDREAGWRLVSTQLLAAFNTLDDACVVGDLAMRGRVPDPHERVGDWIITHSGKKFWPLDPRPAEIDTTDVAHALTMKPRFNGHTSQAMPISVHSMLVAAIANRLRETDINLRHLVPEIVIAYGLLHDANEAYLPDVPRPVKRFIQGWGRIERAVQHAVHVRYGLDPDPPDEVAYLIKEADDYALAMEARALCTENEEGFAIYGMVPFDVTIRELGQVYLAQIGAPGMADVFRANVEANVPHKNYVPQVPSFWLIPVDTGPEVPTVAHAAAPSPTAAWRREVPTVAQEIDIEAKARAEDRLRAEGSL